MAKKKKVVFKSRNDKRDTKIGYLFITPWLIGVLSFAVIPFLMTVVLSFAKYVKVNNGYEFDWVGISHYTNAFLGNLKFNEALFGFITMEIFYVPIILITSFILALVLNKKIKGRAFFRTVFFLPVIIISGSLLSIVFTTTTDTSGVVDQLTSLETSFIYKVIAQYSEQLAEGVAYVYDNFVMILWFTGIPIVLFINGLQKINKNLYEAAAIDGANSWQILWKVVIPNVRPLAIIIAIFSIVQLSILPTSPMYSLIVETIGDTSAYGTASAYAMVYVFVILVIIGISMLILVPREKKMREVITRTQKKQKDITLQKMNQEG